MPPKPAIHPRPDGFVNVMPAYCAGLDGAGVKLVSVFPANRASGLPAINALVIVLDSATGAAARPARRRRAHGLPHRCGLGGLRGSASRPRHPATSRSPARASRRAAICSRSTRSGTATSSCGITAPPTSRRSQPGRTSTPRRVTLRSRGEPERGRRGRGDRDHGHPDRGRGRPHRARGPARRRRSRCRSTTPPRSRPRPPTRAALLLSDDVAQLDGYRGAHWPGWRALDGFAGSWLADGAPPRPAGQIVVANLGVGAHDVVFGSAVLERAEREGIGVLVTP